MQRRGRVVRIVHLVLRTLQVPSRPAVERRDVRLCGVGELALPCTTTTEGVPNPHLHLAVEGRLVLIYRLEYGPVHAPRNIVPHFEYGRSFGRIVAIDLVGRVEICDSNQHGGIIIPLAFRCYRRRPVPAPGRARVDTGVRADGLARHTRNRLRSGDLLDHGLVVLLHVEGHVVLAVVDAEGEDGWYGRRPRRRHGRRGGCW